jgi:hypothetical protein
MGAFDLHSGAVLSSTHIMSANLSRVDLLLQYALLVAGEEDRPFDRELGPIHLLKYVYLGDLAFARRNGGETYTGVRWRFHHFGPWSPAVHDRIAPALQAIGADVRQFESDYEERADWFRWSVRRDDYVADVEGKLPATITLKVRPLIREFGKDTSKLLDYVYRTPPMLGAAPGENLDFQLAATAVSRTERSDTKLRLESVPATKLRRFKEKMAAIQNSAAARLTQRVRLINPVKAPRYDEIYSDGLRWLDELGGENLEPGDKVVEFSPDVWKSITRKGSDVP